MRIVNRREGKRDCGCMAFLFRAQKYETYGASKDDKSRGKEAAGDKKRELHENLSKEVCKMCQNV